MVIAELSSIATCALFIPIVPHQQLLLGLPPAQTRQQRTHHRVHHVLDNLALYVCIMAEVAERPWIVGMPLVGLFRSGYPVRCFAQDEMDDSEDGLMGLEERWKFDVDDVPLFRPTDSDIAQDAPKP